MNIPSIYKPFMGLVLFLVVISALNIPILQTLWRHSFDDGTYSHAYLIPIISLYLYFKLSECGLLRFKEKISFFSLSLLFLCGFLLFITSNAQISIGYWVSFLALLTAGVITLFRFNWFIVFPALFLIFIFPLWGLLTELLQSISVVAVTYMMSFTGIPTYVEAQYITIPAGIFEIADGCSGLRYIIVSLAISSLFIFLYINNVKKAAIFLTIAILGALLTNWIRITALILIGEYTDMQSSLMEDHNTFGWYLYIPFMFLLFVWGNKLTTHDLLSTKVDDDFIHAAPNKLNMAFTLFIVIIFATSIKYAFPNGSSSSPQYEEVFSIQPQIFQPTAINVSPSFLGGNTQLLTYHFNGSDLDAKPTYFDNQFIPEGWLQTDQEIINNWNVNLISKGRQNALVLYQYEIDEVMTATARSFKLTRLLKAIQGVKDTQLHWVYSQCESNCQKELKFIASTE